MRPICLPRDLDPKPRSRRNEPALLAHVAQSVGQLRGESLAIVASLTTHNAETLFGWREP